MLKIFLYEKLIETKIRESLKNNDKFSANVYRNIKTEMVNAEKNNTMVNDTVVLSIIAKYIKQREDVVKLYKSSSRNDLIDNKIKEINLLKPFIPTKISEDDIKKLIAELINNGNTNIRQIMQNISNHEDVAIFDKKMFLLYVKNYCKICL